MQFSKDQMKRMLAGSEQALRRAIQNQVREEHSYVVQDLPKDLFDRMVGGGIQRARSYGLTQPSDLACFVLLMFEFCPEFWRHPAIERVLTDAALQPEQRLARVVDDTPSEVWRYQMIAMRKQHWFPETIQPDDDETKV